MTSLNVIKSSPRNIKVHCLSSKIHILKSKYSAVGIKSSFEDEGTSLKNAVFLRNLTLKNNMKFVMKIGGAEARTDINLCKDIGVDGIVGPMIESEFAAEKFINASKYYDFSRGINIESKQAIENIDSIMKFDNLDYICIGRVDLIASYKLDRNQVNSKFVNDLIYKTIKKIKNKNIKVYMGGSINKNTYDFLRFLFENKLLDRIETRYIILNLDKNLIDNFENALKLANEFELEYMIKNQNEHTSNSKELENRIKTMEDRISDYDVETCHQMVNL